MPVRRSPDRGDRALVARLVAAQAGVPVDAEHLLRGVEREVMKDGRSLSPRDRGAVIGGAG